MHVTVRTLLPLVFLVTARIAAAACDPSADPDRTDIANARAAVAAACDCGAAASNGDYVRCATQAAAAALVNKSCASTVRRCAARSTCGRPGSVACCRTRASGKLVCTIKRSASRCLPPPGGSACVGSVPSCCDACAGGGCTTTTTSSSTPPSTTSTTFPPACGLDQGGTCGGLCPNFADQCVQDSQTGACVCVPPPCRPLGGIGSCYGSCPTGAFCTLCLSCGGCGCITPCDTCGPCPPGFGCALNPSTGTCVCAQ